MANSREAGLCEALVKKQPRAAKLVQLLKVFAATPEAPLFGPQDPCGGKK